MNKITDFLNNLKRTSFILEVETVRNNHEDYYPCENFEPYTEEEYKKNVNKIKQIYKEVDEDTTIIDTVDYPNITYWETHVIDDDEINICVIYYQEGEK